MDFTARNPITCGLSNVVFAILTLSLNANCFITTIASKRTSLPKIMSNPLVIDKRLALWNIAYVDIHRVGGVIVKGDDTSAVLIQGINTR